MLELRCINSRTSAYCMMNEGIMVDDGWLCRYCILRTIT